MALSTKTFTYYLFPALSFLLYSLFAYELERENFYLFSVLYLTLFVLFIWVYQQAEKNLDFLLALSIGFRILFLFAIPNLSQDFFRFIWDGRLLFEGFNPYLSTPDQFIQMGQEPINQTDQLYQGMGTLSAGNHTNYPPINQLCFWLAALFAKHSIMGSIIVMRLIIILADIGLIFFSQKILSFLKLPRKNILLYAINPFIIIELTGNLHFEAVMLFFVVWSIYLLIKNQWLASAVVLGISVSVKLIPLIFLPLFFQFFMKNRWKGFWNYCLFCLVVLLTVAITFLPFLSNEFLLNYKNTVGLWFNKFEFNASLYYLAREYGYTWRGYNEIAVIGKFMPKLAIGFLLLITLFRNNRSEIPMITALLLGLTFYYFTTTTMHPWYISTLVILAVFTNYRYPIVWSIAILLSYQAYANTPWKEHLWLITIEYLIVYGYLFWEIFNLKQIKQKQLGIFASFS